MSYQGNLKTPVPHIDELVETAPPWTLPAAPDYELDPWLENIPAASAASAGPQAAA